jgi:hypothetical protein
MVWVALIVGKLVVITLNWVPNEIRNALDANGLTLKVLKAADGLVVIYDRGLVRKLAFISKLCAAFTVIVTVFVVDVFD